VLNVWKRVDRYARDGFTAVIHGKHYHEETKATASQAVRHPGGRYLIVRDMGEAEILCRFLEGGADRGLLESTFLDRVSPGFDFDRDLDRIGVANQTTMLAGESLAIAERVGRALAARFGVDRLDGHFRSFDTICSATQDRQDAVLALIEEPLDLMLVVGGYNSSNTNNLARICAQRLTTFHIADASCVDPTTGTIRHKPVDRTDEIETRDWLAPGPKRIGITAGASTPNNKIGEAIERVLEQRGCRVDG
jgi:4-hydroxy-3-methylbut-2-enyl diphosphate reductase